MVVTFIISQRNNIPRIRKAVDVLCQTFGTPLGEIDDQQVLFLPDAGAAERSGSVTGIAGLS